VVEVGTPSGQRLHGRGLVWSKASADNVVEVVYPQGWQKHPYCKQLLPATSGHIEAVHALDANTWTDVTARDRKYREPSEMNVVDVQLNHNPALWRTYFMARERVRDQMNGDGNNWIRKGKEDGCGKKMLTHLTGRIVHTHRRFGRRMFTSLSDSGYRPFNQ